MTKVKIEGLNTFEILEAIYNKNTKQFNMKFTMPQISLDANYSLSNKFDTDLLVGNFTNKGSLQWVLNDKSQYEISFYFNNNKTSGDLMVEKFKFVYPNSAKDASEDEITKEVEEFLKKIEKEFDDVYNDYMTARFNKMFKGLKTVEDVADYFNKVAGDSEHGPYNEPLCNHV